MRRVAQSRETARGYNSILQDVSFFVSRPLLNSSSQTKVTEHPAPKRDVEVATDVFLLCSPFCCKGTNAKGIPSSLAALEAVA